MAHDHAHHHGDAQAYFTEQLFNIAVCAAIGGVMVMMFFNGMVTFLFGGNEVQYTRVLLGGAGLLAVVLVRAAFVWFAVGDKSAAHAPDECGHDHGDCGHDHHHHQHEHETGIKAAASTALTGLPLAPAMAVPHSHDHDHDHDHDHGHSHDHGHGHDHGWAPWRFVLLVLPVVLFFLGLPNKGISKGSDMKLTADEQAEVEKLASGKSKGGDVVPMTFLQLERAALSQDARDAYAGRMVSVTGEYFGDNPYRFTLQRYKLNCCAADAIPLKAIIALSPEAQKKYKLDPSKYQKKWVDVTGRLEFFYLRTSNEYVSTIFLDPDDKHPLSELIQEVPPPGNPYAL
jgi:hypothetical protein